MKSLKLLFVIPLLIAMFSCEFQDDFKIEEEEYSFVITGIKESITYVFNSANGRVAEVPDEVKNLTVLVVDEFGEIVFEKRFYEWEHYGEIPDSIRIPTLPAGEYSIYAMTCDYYNHWYEDGVYRGDSTNTPHDTTTTYGGIILEPWIVNEGPIYVGSVTFTLEEDEQHVVIKMENISAKITLASTENIPGWMQVSIEAKASVYYDFKSGDFVDTEYWNYIYMYLDDSTLTKNFYILPQTLKKLNLYFYNYPDYSQVYSPSMELDPPIPMNVGDAITFKIDIEAIMAGAGSSVFEWEDINWNDLGEIPIP
ncbi:hypothetical protein ACFLU5_16865 [Bacteroidota bacterium]